MEKLILIIGGIFIFICGVYTVIKPKELWQYRSYRKSEAFDEPSTVRLTLTRIAGLAEIAVGLALFLL